jgi:hypothetical protein
MGSVHDYAVLHLGVEDGGAVAYAGVGAYVGVGADYAVAADDGWSADCGSAVDYCAFADSDVVG